MCLHFISYQELMYETSPEDQDNTVSSASLCISAVTACEPDADATVCASTPLTHTPACTSTPLAHARPLTNGHDHVDNKINGHNNNDAENGNVSAPIVSESVNSMDVLSGGESDAGDTLTRRNNNSICSGTMGTLREGTGELPRRRNNDVTYFVAKELLMTERTYKRDLELVTVNWGGRVSELAAVTSEAAGALARSCLALEPMALPAGKLLARLERTLTAPSPARGDNETEEPEYKRIAELLHEYLTSTEEAYGTYVEQAGALVALVESVRRCCPEAERASSAFEARSPLSLACLLLRPLHHSLRLETLANELFQATGSSTAHAALELATRRAHKAREQLRHGENHAALCQLQRDIAGYDKLLVAEREFVRLGCLYKHSSRGLQQRMLFLLTDVLVVASRGGAHFRALSAHALHTLHLAPHELPHSFTLTGDDVNLLLSASTVSEYNGWYHALQVAIDNARDNCTDVDTQLTPYEQEIETSQSGAGGGGGGLAHVCWHRVTSLDREHLHLAMRSQLSGYLLRKFKKSPGWQKLWVVFAAFTLFFYKSWQDDTPLASLPLLGYSVDTPAPEDGIDKEFVFKLQFKNHVYFFRADSCYTYNRWTKVLHKAMQRSI